MKYVKKRKLKILHLNAVSANFCCFIICDFRLLLPEPVTNINEFCSVFLWVFNNLNEDDVKDQATNLAEIYTNQ